MPERNRIQAYFPTGAEPIFNSCGTAPGIWMKIGNAWVAAMPGVPSEMHVMFVEQVKTRLLKLGLAGGVLVQRKINCFGAGESTVEEKLFDITRRGHVPEVGITVSDATISLRILAQALTRGAAEVLITPVEKIIRERLGELVYGCDDEELEEAVLRLLAEKRQTLATAESVTCGLVARRLGLVPGASDWFRGGIVAYQNDMKTNLLGVSRELLAEHGAVSAPVAEAMAVGARQMFQSDLAVSTTGLAGPTGEGDKPVGLVFVGIAWDGGVQALKFSWIGTRAEVQSRTAKLALNRVRLHLLGNRNPMPWR
jgi:nicotinamide-nucleotide amidase